MIEWLGNEWGIERLSAALRDGDLSAVELTEAVLAQCEATQPRLNAFIEILHDEALQVAEERDRARAQGSRLGSLHGIPIAFKDMFDWPGHRCTYGSAAVQERSPEQSAPVVQRLIKAGAVPIGFLNMAELTLGTTGANIHYGACHNPWDVARVAGGSSGGTGVAVAARLVAGALGSDAGGSTRIPSACCGVTGLRPTQASIDRTGSLPLAPTLDTVGLSTISAADCMLLYQVAAETDVHLPSERGRADAPRLAYPLKLLESGDAQVRVAFGNALRTLEAQGAIVAETELSTIPEIDDLAEAIQLPEMALVHAERLRLRPSLLDPRVRARLEEEVTISATAYLDALKRQPELRRDFIENTLGAADALVMPTLPLAVPLLTVAEEDGSPIPANLAGWTRWVNYLDLPAVTIPCGWDPAGMPVGMQIVGRRGKDLALLNLAAWIQARTSWHQAIPPEAE